MLQELALRCHLVLQLYVSRSIHSVRTILDEKFLDLALRCRLVCMTVSAWRQIRSREFFSFVFSAGCDCRSDQIDRYESSLQAGNISVIKYQYDQISTVKHQSDQTSAIETNAIRSVQSSTKHPCDQVFEHKACTSSSLNAFRLHIHDSSSHRLPCISS